MTDSRCCKVQNSLCRQTRRSVGECIKSVLAMVTTSTTVTDISKGECSLQKWEGERTVTTEGRLKVSVKGQGSRHIQTYITEVHQIPLTPAKKLPNEFITFQLYTLTVLPYTECYEVILKLLQLPWTINHGHISLHS